MSFECLVHDDSNSLGHQHLYFYFVISAGSYMILHIHSFHALSLIGKSRDDSARNAVAIETFMMIDQNLLYVSSSRWIVDSILTLMKVTGAFQDDPSTAWRLYVMEMNE